MLYDIVVWEIELPNLHGKKKMEREKGEGRMGTLKK